MVAGVAVSCIGVSKSFDILSEGGVWRLIRGSHDCGVRFTALDGIDLEVQKGHFVGVLGRNGAGKSTLLRTLGGVYTPDFGAVRIDGDLSGLYELGISGNPWLSGREYASRTLRILGAPGKIIDELVVDVLEFSELGARFDDPIFTYSAGMSARLFFATATARQHDVYLIDEALSVGDEHFQQKCWRRVRERLKAGASGVLVTHDWSAVLKICESARVLERGRFTHGGASDEVVRRYLNENNGLVTKSDVARFLSIPNKFELISGQDSKLEFDVEITADQVNVLICFAIERMTLGVGWEIVLNGIDLPVSNRRGLHNVCILIPRLPLVAGKYQFGASLVTVNPADKLDRTVLDSRGWLHGKPVEVEVLGDSIAASVDLPVSWKVSTK